MSQGVIDAELRAGRNNLGLCHFDDGRVDAVSAPALDCGCGGEVGCLLEGGDKFRPAVGIAAIIGGIDADKDIERAQNLGPGEGVAQEYRIAGRDVSCRDLGRVVQAGPVHGYVNGLIGQGRAAECGQVDFDNTMFCCPERLGNLFRRLDFPFVSLAIGKSQGTALETVAACEGQSRGRIQASAK